MGTYYTLGVITEFAATATQTLTNEEWISELNERVDVSLFDLQPMGTSIEARLKERIFSENIPDFYEVLRSILGVDRNRTLDYYEEDFGNDLEEYQIGRTNICLQRAGGPTIQLEIEYALLLIEGKVDVEEFNTDPILINWLFRNSKIENKLAGCIISDITS